MEMRFGWNMEHRVCIGQVHWKQ